MLRHKLIRQFSWTFGARLSAATMQMGIVLLLAIGLPPSRFALVSTVIVVVQALTALNGFGLQRQIQYRRSLDPSDALLPALYEKRLRFTYWSVFLWCIACVALAIRTGSESYLALLPVAIWLMADQTTQVWNGISLADGRASQLVPSSFFRRLPALVSLGVATHQNWDILWSWTIGMAAGGILSMAYTIRDQDSWARRILPKPREPLPTVALDFGFWWSQVSLHIRDFDVPLLAAVDPYIAGIYALPARFIRPLTMVTSSMSAVAFPELSRRSTVAYSTLARLVVISTIPSLALGGSLAVVASPLLAAIGPDYAPAIGAFRYASFTIPFLGLSTMLTTFLQSRPRNGASQAGAILLVGYTLQLAAAVSGGVAAGATGAAAGVLLVQVLVSFALAFAAVAHLESTKPRNDEVN